MIIPFNIKTDASLLKSLIKIDDLIDRAKILDLKALTITDDKMYNVIEFYQKCIKANIKPIIGLEITISNYPILLYAKNNEGYSNLIHLSSLENIDFENLKDNGLLVIIPFNSINISEQIENIFSDVYYGYTKEEEYQKIKDKKSIYVNPIHFLEASDAIYMPYLNSIRTGEPLQSNYPMYYLKSKEEYQKLEKNINYHQEIFEKCNVTIEKRNDLLPIYECPEHQDSFIYLKKLCLEGTQKKLGNIVPKIYQERLKMELDVINEMGFCNYFLIVYDYVKFAKEHNILVGPGRGSAAGSLVSYVLDITDIDPIRYKLLFERFLNKMRITMPDIDIDFEFLRREEVIDYCISKYGSKKVAGIITFGTLGAKQALRDVARTLDVQPSKIEQLTKVIDSKIPLLENFKNKNVKQILQDKELLQIYQVALHLEGLKRHTSIHAAGIIMSSVDLDEVVPIEKRKNMYVTGYSMEYLEGLGLLKMDFLALETLTTIQNILESINKDGKIIELDEIPLNDAKTFELFQNGNTLGVFQFEKPGMINFLRKLKPKNFEDIFAALALYRPGPMDNIDSYIRRKEGKEQIDYIDSSIEEILKPTYGIIIYQEQIMQIACTLAGYTMGEADILRRAISKKKENVLLDEKEKFISKTINMGHSKETASKVFDYILKFASYGFNRSHSVAYAMLSYKMAYLKAHYNDHFMRCLLTSAIGSVVDTKDYIEECKNNHIEILTPNINESGKVYLVTDKGILYPLSNIKNIGYTIVDAILEERKKGLFKDIYDFIKRTDRKMVNKKVLESLILSGTFDCFNINRKTLKDSIDIIMNYGEVIKDLNEEYTLKPVLEIEEEYTNTEKMEHELELFGFYLSHHPIVESRKQYPTAVPLKNIEHYFDKIIDVVILVETYKPIENKNNQKMAFLLGSDESKKLDFVLFPNVYEVVPLIKKGDILLIRGKIEKRFDKYQMVVNNLKKI